MLGPYIKRIAALTLLAASAHAAVSLTTSGIKQNFDSMSTTLNLPTDWRVDRPSTVRTVGTYSAASPSVQLTGSALGSSAANGTYNLGATSPTTDRAVGFISSGSGTTSGNLYVQMVNNTGFTVTALQISYNVEKYRTGINASGFQIQMYTSADGVTWTSAGSTFLTQFPGPDANNNAYLSVPGATKSVTNQTLQLTLPAGGNLYVAWNYSVISGTTVTNAQSLAVDDISIVPLPNGAGTATPSSVAAGNSTLLTVAVTPGVNPSSTGITVSADLTAIGGSATQQFFDDGTHGDQAAGDGTYSFDATTAAGTSAGIKILPVTVSDAQSRTGTTSISLTILGPTPPTGTSAASPSTVQPGNSTLLTIAVTPGANPTSTGLAVVVDLGPIGGSASQSFYDDGTHGDATAGDNIFSFTATVDPATSTGSKTLNASISDAQTRSGSASIPLNVAAQSTNPTGSGSASPNSLLAGASTLLTVAVTPGANPVSTGIVVTTNLSSIGGLAAQQFFDDGTNGDVTSGDGIYSFNATVTLATTPGAKTLPVTITDAQSRSGSTSISLTVQSPPAPSSVKISQVYGGGGNSGSTYKNDFIELFNQSTTPVDISAWSVQQLNATGTGAWNVTNLCAVNSTCVIQPGHYYLVQESAGAGGTTNLPAADIVGTLALGAGSGKVALLNTTTPLSGSCPSGAGIADLVGYDSSATCFEGAPAPTPSNTTGVLRKGNGCTDTNNNSGDFVELGPLPRNSSAPPQTCAAPGQLSGLGTATPSSVDPGGNTLLKVAVTTATNPSSTNVTVTGNLSGIGGSATQQFFDDGTNGDAAAGDGTYSFRIDLSLLATGAYYISTTVADAQGRHVTVPITITVQSPTCGVERWSIKVGTDADAGLVNLASPVRTTIQSLRSLTAPIDPPGPPLDHRVQPTETTVYVVNGLLTLYKKEDDVDYHIVIQDPSGNTMVTEIPSPACDGTTSPFDAAIAAVRAKFDARLTAITSFQPANIPVQMKGVGFFDFLHGQTGVAPNGIELHPILDLSFTAQSTATLTSDLSPASYGQTPNLTATVTIPSGTPTGKVSFFDGTTPLGTASLDGNGHATISAGGLNAGTHALSASYEGDSASSESSGTLSLLVNPAAPVLSWTKPADIIYGSALGATQLNATANVPGSFVYNPPAGTVLPIGNNQTLNAAFTPNSTNYASGSVSTTINVVQSGTGNGQPNIVITRSLARVNGQVVATLTIANTGGADAPNVVLTTAKIGTTSGTPLPQSLGAIAAGASVQATVTFPGTVGASGTAGSITLSGTYTGGTFTSSARITLP
jgi:hypothetical protein